MTAPAARLPGGAQPVTAAAWGCAVGTATSIGVDLRCRCLRSLAALRGSVRLGSRLGSGRGHAACVLTAGTGGIRRHTLRFARWTPAAGHRDLNASPAGKAKPQAGLHVLVRPLGPITAGALCGALHALAVHPSELYFETAVRTALWPGAVAGVMYEESRS